MFIVDSARRLFGIVDVEVITRPRAHTQVKISGIRGDLLSKDLQYYFNTTRVAKHMFDKITSSSVVFPAFFALEVLAVMDKIIDAPRTNYTSRRTANTVKEALLEKTWLVRLEEKDFPHRLNLRKLELFKLQPLPYQQTWLERFEEASYRFTLNGVILDGAPGAGKTMMGLYISECAEVDVTIVVTPKNAIDRVWADTLNHKLNYQPTIWRSDRPSVYKGERYCLVHYEYLEQSLAMVRELHKKNKRVCVVVDESHNFNDLKSARTQYVIQMCQETKSEYIVLQSGTPFKAIGAEIIPALYCIDPTFSDDLAERFKKLYAASATEALTLLQRRLGYITHKEHKEELNIAPPIIQNVKVKSANGTKYTLESVAAEMQQFIRERGEYYRSRKADDEKAFLEILEQFELNNPSKADTAYKQYLSDLKTIRRGDLRAAKDEIVRANSFERTVILPNLSSEDAKVFKEVKTIYKYVVLKIQGECLGRIVGRRRMECSVEIARSVDYDKFIESTTKKTLVYTIYVQALEAARDTVIASGYKPAMVYAETNKNLAAIVSDFERNPEVNPLIATFHSLSTAVPLVMSDTMVMFDLPFRDYQLQQAIARINRIGATTQTYVHICILDTDNAPNMSTRTVDILKWSQSQIEKITGVAPPFEVTDTQMSVEAFGILGKAMGDQHFVELDLESAFMDKLV